MNHANNPQPISKLRTIVVVPYDRRWPILFEQEAAAIAAVFGEELLTIHHIGSTSVPGLAAKPIIDIMPVAREIERVDEFNPTMSELGYQPMGENEIAGRRFFRKAGNENRTHHVHTYMPDNPEVARHLDFRDYLRAHPAEAAAYGRLKAALAQQFSRDIDGYVAGKDSFIKDIIEKARAWRAQRPVAGPPPSAPRGR